MKYRYIHSYIVDMQKCCRHCHCQAPLKLAAQTMVGGPPFCWLCIYIYIYVYYYVFIPKLIFKPFSHSDLAKFRFTYLEHVRESLQETLIFAGKRTWFPADFPSETNRLKPNN